MQQPTSEFFSEKLQETKEQFERTIDCKHTEFDDLYPYMNEQPQFFWYKRYVAWQDLLTIVRMAEELDIDWQHQFQNSQVSFIKNKVLDAKVLDEWYGRKRTEA
ncbi:hypothetical protein [Salibacterium lacus]|uniref:Uncharacterized protein n=1 Tax=Salibacterium lacus TaxID=1898109 RepID=A0ABW5SYY2_9BACI